MPLTIVWLHPGFVTCPVSISASASAVPRNPSYPQGMAGFFCDPIPVGAGALHVSSYCIPITQACAWPRITLGCCEREQRQVPPSREPSQCVQIPSATHLQIPSYHVPPRRVHTYTHALLLPLAISCLFTAAFSLTALLIIPLTDAWSDLSPRATRSHSLIFPLFYTRTLFYSETNPSQCHVPQNPSYNTPSHTE